MVLHRIHERENARPGSDGDGLAALEDISEWVKEKGL